MANDLGLRVPSEKICSNCSRWLSLESFPRNERMHFGRHSWCRECAREATRDWRRLTRVVSWMNEQRRLGERVKDCVDCGSSFTSGLACATLLRLPASAQARAAAIP